MKIGDRDRTNIKNRLVYHAVLPITVILFLGLSWYIVIRQIQGLTQAAITAYQQTELEIVRTAARAIEHYVYNQVDIHNRDEAEDKFPIDAIEQEIFTQFIAPIRLLENGDAWIYTPDYVVFDRSSDFPDAYRGKNMAEIFAIQAKLGASHYEAMTDAVMHAREGVGWYIWLPDKGKEIAAWTPVQVGEYTWIIGLSTPLPEIMISTGARQQIRAMTTIISLGSLLTLALLLAWGYSALQRWRTDQALSESQRMLGDIFDAIEDGIMVLDKDLTILHVNHAMEQQHAQTMPLVGQKCFVALRRQPTPCENCAAMRAMKSQHIQTDVMALSAPGDSKQWIEIHAYPLFDAEGEIRGVVEHARNVTERVQTEQRKAALQERLKQQNRTLSRLSTHPALAEGDLKRALPVMTEMTTATLGIARANIWQFSPDEYEMHCLEAFERASNTHSAGLVIQTEAYPHHVAALRSGIVLDTPDVQTDPRTVELTDDYWRPLGIHSTIEAPIRLHGQMTGVLCYEHTGPPRTWTSDEVAFVTQVADLVAQTFLNAEIRSRAERLAVVNRITRAVGATLQLDDLLEIVCHQIMAVFKADAFFIALYDEERRELDFRIQVDRDIQAPPTRRPLGIELTAYVITEKRPLLIRDFEQEQHDLPTPELWGTMRCPASWLGVPMQVGEQVTGVVCVQAYKPYAYGKEEELLLSTIADQVAIAVQSARLYKTIQQELIERKRAEEERERLLAAEHEQRILAETLAEVTLALTSRTRHEAVLDEILTQAQRIVPFKTANITLLQEDLVTGDHRLYAARMQGYEAFDTEAYIATLVQPLSDFPIDAEAIHSRKPIVVFDTQQDPRWVQLDKTTWIRACLFVPICLRDRVLGLLRMDSDIPHAFTEKDAQRLQPLANAAAIAIENARLVEGLEAEVAARTSEIRTEKEKLEIILRHVGDAILMVDAERHIQYINKGYTALTGYTLDDVLGKTANTIGAILSEKSEQLIQATLGKGELWQGEVIVRRKDGRTYDAALTIAPMYDVDDHFIGYVASHRDISRLKELERARNRFIANISHQFRTPVTTLRLQAYMMKRREPLEENRKYLVMMEQQIAQLDHLIQDILDMAALDSGQVVRTWDPLDLSQTFDTLLTRYQSQAQASELTLHIRPPAADLPTVKGDQERFSRALGEIVENAIKFTPAGGQITVQAESVGATAQNRTWDEQTWLAISVQDTGPGISPEEREKVFDNFFRGSLAEAGHIPGTGLGLSLAQEIVRAHGGKITVESQVGEGTTFTVWLPTRS